MLQPMAWVYGQVVSQRTSFHAPSAFACPIIVIGNIVVGGTGKTLLLSWLIVQCQNLGLKVGVVSRGYGGRSAAPTSVHIDSDPQQVGDEPLMIRQLGVPVVVAKQRSAAVKKLLRAHPELDLVFSDDGLQHSALPRDLEICLFDGVQSIGNGKLLPAGPLREPLARLNQVDWVICKSAVPAELKPWQPITMHLKALPLKALANSLAVASAPPEQNERIIALCGIGQPDSFFALLRQLGWEFEPFALPDHAVLNTSILTQLTDRTVLMTSKDAIKLRHIQLPCRAWELPVSAHFASSDQDRILNSIQQLLPTSTAHPFKDHDHD